jgi:biopolymer transport protein ExbD
MKINLDTAADDAQIQIVPMIDVIFCILTFFILAALQLTRQQGMNIDLPKATSGVVQQRQLLVVSIDQTGQTFIDQNVVDRSQLYTLLKQYHEKNPNGVLVLNASQNAFYNDVIQVLDVMRSVGGEKVALATIPAPSINPTTPPGGNTFGAPGINPTSPNLFPGTAPNGAFPGIPGGLGQPLPGAGTPLSPDGSNTPGSTAPGATSPGTTPGTTTPGSTANPVPGSNSVTPSGGAIPAEPLGEPGLPPGATTDPGGAPKKSGVAPGQ